MSSSAIKQAARHPGPIYVAPVKKVTVGFGNGVVNVILEQAQFGLLHRKKWLVSHIIVSCIKCGEGEVNPYTQFFAKSQFCEELRHKSRRGRNVLPCQSN